VDRWFLFYNRSTQFQAIASAGMTQRRRNTMGRPGHTHTRVGTGLIWISVVLLVGILVLAAGYFTGNRLAFYAGTLVTLAGVFTGIQRLFLRDRSEQPR
jgi:uncharacterized membrane protein HdeD (DUF308 family)